MVAEDDVDAIVRAMRRRNAPIAGRLGERTARAGAPKVRIPAASGRAQFRVPDLLTDSELIEVKNVARLRWTWQLSDFLTYADATGRQFVLYTRHDTTLSRRLRLLIGEGQIEHRVLGGFLSPVGRRVLTRIVHEALEADERKPEPGVPDRISEQ